MHRKKASQNQFFAHITCNIIMWQIEMLHWMSMTLFFFSFLLLFFFFGGVNSTTNNTPYYNTKNKNVCDAYAMADKSRASTHWIGISTEMNTIYTFSNTKCAIEMPLLSLCRWMQYDHPHEIEIWRKNEITEQHQKLLHRPLKIPKKLHTSSLSKSSKNNNETIEDVLQWHKDVSGVHAQSEENLGGKIAFSFILQNFYAQNIKSHGGNLHKSTVCMRKFGANNEMDLVAWILLRASANHVVLT